MIIILSTKCCLVNIQYYVTRNQGLHDNRPSNKDEKFERRLKHVSFFQSDFL